MHNITRRLQEYYGAEYYQEITRILRCRILPEDYENITRIISLGIYAYIRKSLKNYFMTCCNSIYKAPRIRLADRSE